ncbi:MAG TPA: ribonuclease P protein component [Bacteroidaceae bacterium]|nr:ribonuclease P protein component [Bacteroidaceae bacterium]
MSDYESYTLPKEERIFSQRVLDMLFSKRNNSFFIFPLRVVYTPIDELLNTRVAILTSVSKRHFKRAVKRNRIKRQIREAYRTQKHIVLDELIQSETDTRYAVAFLYQSDREISSEKMHEAMQACLERLHKEWQ